MAKKLLNGCLSIVFLAASGFFVYVVYFLFSAEVLPAIRQGSLNIQTDSMILNQLWEGNQLYLLITVYLLLACAFAYGSYRAGKRAMS